MIVHYWILHLDRLSLSSTCVHTFIANSTVFLVPSGVSPAHQLVEVVQKHVHRCIYGLKIDRHSTVWYWFFRHQRVGIQAQRSLTFEKSG